MKDVSRSGTRTGLPECGTYPYTGLTSNPVRKKLQAFPGHDPQHDPPCGLVRRLASMVYDALLVVALLMVAAAVVVVPAGTEVNPGTVWFQGYLLLVWWLYFAVCWRVGGQTVGMKAWRIHLATGHGTPLGWPGTALRFLGAMVSAAAFGLGYIWSLFDPQRRAWHDILTGSRLVVAPKPARND